MEINRHISSAVAKEFSDSTLVDTRTGKTVSVDQIEGHIQQFRCVVEEYLFLKHS